ncbi:MAG TPA: META and DUF4377 domain-containing protein [Pseudoxanthomonas sp.]
MKHCLLLMLPLLALAACTRPAQDAPAPAVTDTPATTTPAPTATTADDASLLTGYHWRLTDAKDASGKRIDALFARADQPLQLDFSEGRLSVGNTCNRMGGSYMVEGSQLKLGDLASTLMACADSKLMALDQEIGKRLQGALGFALQASDPPQLTLTSASGDALVFAGEATAETRYGGKGETVFLEVAAQTKPCSHPLIPDKQCLQVREITYDDKGIKSGTDGEFQNFYDGIEGYAHESGIRNVLRVKRYAIKNPQADASSIAYVLDMVIESEVVKP